MERKYFSWKGWDQQDTMVFTFYDVEFIKKIGRFWRGEKFDSVDVDYKGGRIVAYNNSGQPIKRQDFEWAPAGFSNFTF